MLTQFRLDFIWISSSSMHACDYDSCPPSQEFVHYQNRSDGYSLKHGTPVLIGQVFSLPHHFGVGFSFCGPFDWLCQCSIFYYYNPNNLIDKRHSLPPQVVVLVVYLWVLNTVHQHCFYFCRQLERYHMHLWLTLLLIGRHVAHMVWKYYF